MTFRPPKLPERFSNLAFVTRGGMGEVFRGVDETTGAPVAVKVLRANFEGVEAAWERFSREVEILSTLGSDTVVRYVAHGKTRERDAFLVMEWLTGDDLAKRLIEGPLSIEEVLAIGARISDALASLHAHGVLHRDIKPSNILLKGDSTAGATLVDFGLAHVLGTARLTSAEQVVGTPLYMSPEQIRGAGLDPRTDVYSLGVILYECLAGRPPFPEGPPVAVMASVLFESIEPIRAVRADVPLELANLVTLMLEKDPTLRPADGAAVRKALQRVSSTRPPRAAPSAPRVVSTVAMQERRMTSVIMVAPSQTSEEQASETGAAREDEALFAVAKPYAARAERVQGGSLVFALQAEGNEESSARAAMSARCALAIHAAARGRRVVLVTGRAEAEEGFPMGEFLERGARLLAAPAHARANGVSVDATTAALLERSFVVEHGELGHVLFAEQAEATTTSLFTPFVGRTVELQLLRDAYERAARGPARTGIFVFGETGVGKTRLTREIRAWLLEHPDEPRVYFAQADMGRTDPLSTIASALRRSLGAAAASPAEIDVRLAERVRAVVDGTAADEVTAMLRKLMIGKASPTRLGRGAPSKLLGSVLGAKSPVEPDLTEEFELAGDRIRSACLEFFGAELRTKPVVVLVDGAQGIDAASLSLLQDCFAAFAHRPFCLMMSGRPALEARLRTAFSRDVESFVLGLLPADAARVVAKHLVPDDEALAARIVAQAAGNPLFLEELARAASREDDRKALPPTLVAAVESMLARLPPVQRRILRVASVFGVTVPWSGLVAALPDVAELQSHVQALVQAVVLLPFGDRLRFRSESIQQAAYALLTEEDRALLHRQVATWLGSIGDADAATIAGHFDLAGDTKDASAWYAQAAQVALERGDFGGVIERAEQGILAGASGALLGRMRLIQSEAHRYLGETRKTGETAREAMKYLPERAPGWWCAVANAANAALRLSTPKEFDAIIDVVLSGPITPTPDIARLCVYILQLGGRDQVADQLLAVVESAMARGHSPEKWGWGHRAMGYREMTAHGSLAFHPFSRRAVEAFDRAGDMRDLSQELVALGFSMCELGRFEESDAVLLRACFLADRLNLPHTLAFASEIHGKLMRRMGRNARAIELLRNGLAIATRSESFRVECALRRELALVLAAEGALDDAHAEVERARALVTNFAPLVPITLAVSARVLSLRGEMAAAVDVAMEVARSLEAPRSAAEADVEAGFYVATVLELGGKEVAALEVARSVERRFLSRVSRLEDALRRTCVEVVPEHRELLALTARLDDDIGSRVTLEPTKG